MESTERGSEILLIEDDLVFVKILAALNEEWRLPITFCSRDEEIEAALDAPQRFGMVISDCHLPRLDILGRLAELRTTHPEIDVVLMSYMAEEDLRDESAGLAPQLIEPKDGIVRDPAAFAERIRALADRHAAS